MRITQQQKGLDFYPKSHSNLKVDLFFVTTRAQ